MPRRLNHLVIALALSCVAFAARADDCAICGQPITARFYFMTDKVTGQQVEVCPNCIQLPRCFVCGLPVKDGVQLSDGRWLCARDAKTAVMDIDDAQRIFGQVHDDLDRQFARFTSFPTNVNVSVIDRVDVDSMFQLIGNRFESPDVLGVTEPYYADGVKRYKICLLTGQPLAQLEEVCAHELSHAWVGENVPPERHARIARDAEEGFCEMMGYLYMDAMSEDGEKRRVLANAYTRGQVKLFIAAEQQYGFDAILAWMQYGAGSELQEGHLDEVRDVQTPGGSVASQAAHSAAIARGSLPPPAPATLQLQGILWSSAPSAIINGQSFFMWDEYKVRVGQTNAAIRCLSITKNAVEILNLNSGRQEELELPGR